MSHTTAHALLVLGGVALSLLCAYTTLRFGEWSARQLEGRELTAEEALGCVILWPSQITVLLCTWLGGFVVALIMAITSQGPPDDGAGGTA